MVVLVDLLDSRDQFNVGVAGRDGVEIWNPLKVLFWLSMFECNVSSMRLVDAASAGFVAPKERFSVFTAVALD